MNEILACQIKPMKSNIINGIYTVKYKIRVSVSSCVRFLTTHKRSTVAT